ncbi:MAG: hypothetical protein NTU94_13760 [Planctomycetota bacterium]|nr:hypothetical protein [Planctomycetota bacterium]
MKLALDFHGGHAGQVHRSAGPFPGNRSRVQELDLGREHDAPPRRRLECREGEAVGAKGAGILAYGSVGFLDDKTPAGEFFRTERPESLEKGLSLVLPVGPLVLKRQAVHGRDEARVERDDLLEHLRALFMAAQAEKGLAALVDDVRVFAVDLVNRLKVVEGLFVVAKVLVIEPEAEAGGQVMGLRRQEGLEDLARRVQVLLRPLLSVHVEVREAEVESRRRPIGGETQDRLERLGRLGVGVLLQESRPAVELGQGFGLRAGEDRRGAGPLLLGL